MNKLIKRATSAWLIFIKNKIAGAVMMLLSGVMMLYAAMNGNGNDTKTLPLMILTAGFVFSLWGFYRIGYIKSDYDKGKEDEDIKLMNRGLIFQMLETGLYLIVAGFGIFLLLNESFVDRALNLMAGGFTVLNGIFGLFYLVKHRKNNAYALIFRFLLTVAEFTMGAYFIVNSESIAVENFIMLGSVTSVAGIIEVIHAITRENLKNTLKDSREIIRALKDKHDDPKEEDLMIEAGDEYDDDEDDFDITFLNDGRS
jgi:uncharacterized membrane protein HdeD (DUF308 family)